MCAIHSLLLFCSSAVVVVCVVSVYISLSAMIISLFEIQCGMGQQIVEKGSNFLGKCKQKEMRRIDWLRCESEKNPRKGIISVTTHRLSIFLWPNWIECVERWWECDSIFFFSAFTPDPGYDVISNKTTILPLLVIRNRQPANGRQSIFIYPIWFTQDPCVWFVHQVLVDARHFITSSSSPLP